MGESPVPEEDLTGGSAVGRPLRWRIGTLTGIVGLVVFVVLCILLVIGMLGSDPSRRESAVGLFPWALGALGVGLAGMGVAGLHRGPGDATDGE